METQIILDISQPYILLAIGITLIALETFIGSFVVIWFGLGFIITAGISYFYEFSDGIWEIATVSIISEYVLGLTDQFNFKSLDIVFPFLISIFSKIVLIN